MTTASRLGGGRLAYPAFLWLITIDATGFGIIGPVLPAISRATDVGPGVASTIVAMYGVGMIIGFQPGGAGVQRYGAARVILCSALLMALGAAGFATMQSLPVYFAGCLVMGIASGGLWMGITLGVVERWPGKEYRRLSGVMACYSIGGLLGPGLAALGGIRLPYIAYIGVIVIGLAALPLIGPPHQHAPRFASDRTVLRSPAFRVAVAGTMLLAVGFGTLEGPLPLHFATRLSQAGIAALYVGSALLIAVFAVIAGRLQLRPAGLAGVALVVSGIGLAAAGDSLWSWIVGIACASAGFGLGETSSMGFLLEAAGPARLLLALVVWSQLFSVGFIIGPIAGGAVAATLGYAAVGLVPLAVGIAVFVAILRLPRAALRTEAQGAQAD